MNKAKTTLPAITVRRVCASMELCIQIDTNTGFQFDGYVVIPDSDLLDPASYQRFVKFGEVGSLLRNIILQVIDVFLRVQAEIARRANITPDGKKRIYSSRYALSSIVFCGHCGDIYRRIKWNNRGCKSTVWRCVSRVLKKDSGIDVRPERWERKTCMLQFSQRLTMHGPEKRISCQLLRRTSKRFLMEELSWGCHLGNRRKDKGEAAGTPRSRTWWCLDR